VPIDAVEGRLHNAGDPVVDRSSAFSVNTQRTAQLADADKHRGRGGKADHHRIRDESGQAPHARETETKLNHPDQDGKQQDRVDVGGGSDLVHR